MAEQAEHTYALNEIVGTSTESVHDAIKNGVYRASRTLRNLDRFKVVEVLRPRGSRSLARPAAASNPAWR
jgi:flavin-binding protein dodecin